MVSVLEMREEYLSIHSASISPSLTNHLGTNGGIERTKEDHFTDEPISSSPLFVMRDRTKGIRRRFRPQWK